MTHDGIWSRYFLHAIRKILACIGVATYFQGAKVIVNANGIIGSEVETSDV